ncbi:hypothetical protein [Pseudonocardia sp. TRM90224]|uniref:hypothetical protein n=1 Tax=Pseudonocardia sp. TRM90224 TaxID=2812678 RepID=UPI001E57CCC4|nr:hypothetical protein [Pseudonocardia sp. TRM90224]
MALGVAGGYFLGRTKKMKLALMLGGMVAGRRAGGPGELIAKGTSLLSSSPELSKLTGEVRGRLVEAGKAAALAVAARQVESLTDRVSKRVESIGDLGRQKDTKTSDDEAPPEDETDERGDEPAEEDDAADDAADDSGDDGDAPRSRTSTRGTSQRKTSGSTATKRSTPASRTRSAAPKTAQKAASKTASKTAGATKSAATNGRRTRTRRSTSDG